MTNARLLVCLVIGDTSKVGTPMMVVTRRGSASSSPGSLGTLALQNKICRFFGHL